ncbi:MAG: hypothetical protein ACT4PV_07595 [Planctomycetaceae bacterium]
MTTKAPLRTALFALSALSALLPVGCAARGALASLPAPRAEAVLLAPPPPPSLDSSLHAAVEDYLVSFPQEHPSYAPATGGLFGWIIPQVYVWFPFLKGDMDTGDGERVDFRDDLGLDEGELTVMPQLQVSLGSLGFRFSAFFARFEGSGRIDRTFTFGGISFPVSEEVTSEVRIDNYRLLSFYPIVRTDFFTLALQGGISFFHVEGTVTGATTGRASDSASLPLPMGGVVLQAKIGRFLLEADIAGFTIDFGDIGATFLDAQASLGFIVFKVVAVRVGYRHLLLDAHADEFSIDVTLSGFFAGLSFQF